MIDPESPRKSPQLGGFLVHLAQTGGFTPRVLAISRTAVSSTVLSVRLAITLTMYTASSFAASVAINFTTSFSMVSPYASVLDSCTVPKMGSGSEGTGRSLGQR